MRKVAFRAQRTMPELRKKTAHLGLMERACSAQLALAMSKRTILVRTHASDEHCLAELCARQVWKRHEFCCIVGKLALRTLKAQPDDFEFAHFRF